MTKEELLALSASLGAALPSQASRRTLGGSVADLLGPECTLLSGREGFLEFEHSKLDAPLVLLLPRGYVARGLRQRYGAQLNAQSKLPRLNPEQDVARALLASLSADELARMTAHLPAAACVQIRAMAADQSRMAAM